MVKYSCNLIGQERDHTQFQPLQQFVTFMNVYPQVKNPIYTSIDFYDKTGQTSCSLIGWDNLEYVWYTWIKLISKAKSFCILILTYMQKINCTPSSFSDIKI